MNLRGAIVDRIKDDGAIAALVDTYDIGDGLAPAVFSPRKPDDYEWKTTPAIVVRKPTSLDDKSVSKGANSVALVSIVVYALMPENGMSSVATEDVANLLRELFRGKSFVGSDSIEYQAFEVTGPIAAPVDNQQMTGELIQVRFWIGA